MPTEVLPPSRRGETAAVVRAAVAILVVALLWISSGRMRFGASDPEDGLLPYQRSFADLEPALQRAMRELHEGALEAMRLRGEEGKWPDVARLTAELVPPFADDGVDRGARRWSSCSGEFAWQYLGGPTRNDGTRALLVQFLEPRPGDTEGTDPRSPVILDEVHRRLSDGTLLHVSFWFESAGVPGPSDGFLRDPALEGWTQVLRRSP